MRAHFGRIADCSANGIVRASWYWTDDLHLDTIASSKNAERDHSVMPEFRFKYPDGDKRKRFMAEGVFVFNTVDPRPDPEKAKKTNQKADTTSTNIESAINGLDVKPRLTTYTVGPITHKASQAFTDAIYDEIHAGYGFTPLLGAGFSVSAGIPIINQLRQYLQRCICIALGVEDDAIGKEGPRQLWNPRTDRWPPLIDRKRAKTHEWIPLMETRLAKERKEENSNAWIYQEALGAMAEWRTSLLFISRLIFDRPRVRTPEGNEGYVDPPLQPRLGQPSQSVVDAGWREWMRDKRPSLNHKLLASLSGLLRIDIIMTTNFDDLLERAFEESRNPLQVFDVRLVDGLPELEIVSQRRSLVKMHGSTRSLRADYSLDGEPSAEDKKLFSEYLAGQRLDRYLPVTEKGYRPHAIKHLLVLGVGATEARTMAFVTYALKTLPDLKVFWISYTEDGVKGLIDYGRTLDPKDKRGSDAKARIFVLRHTDAGLLFLHLFQTVRRTLPPNNAVYPAVTQLSIPPLPKPDTNLTPLLNSFKKKLLSHIKKHPLCLATAADRVPGITTICAEVFRELEPTYVCMWIEMNDIDTIDELFETIQETAYLKLGQRDWTPLYAAEDNRPRKLEVKRLADASSKEYVIFINAREKPGANREFSDDAPNTWLDKRSHWEKLDDLLGDLGHAREGRFKVVLLCRDENSSLANGPHRFVGNKQILRGKTEDPQKTITDVMAWLDRECLDENQEPLAVSPLELKSAKLQFLHTLALMQRSRHLAIVWSRSVILFPDSAKSPDRYWDNSYDPLRLQWLDDLEGFGLLRRKDGGFIWLHSGLRELLRTALLQLGDARFGCEQRAEIHQSIALWYLKLFDSVLVPPAVFEAVDHLCLSAAHLIVGADKRKGANADDDRARLLQTATRRVKTAYQLLQQHTFLIFTQGYPRASSRRLKQISNFWTNKQWMTLKPDGDPKKEDSYEMPSEIIERLRDELKNRTSAEAVKLHLAIAKLQCVTVEVALMIAREIGEDKNAYECLHILAHRLGTPQFIKDEELSGRVVVIEEFSRVKGKINKKLVRKKVESWHKTAMSSLVNTPEAGNNRAEEWIRWWLRCGLLGIGTRSFEEAERSLFRAITAANTLKVASSKVPLPLELTRWKSLTSKLAFDLNAKLEGQQQCGDRYKAYLEGIYAVEEASYLFILRANAASRFIALYQSRRYPITDDAESEISALLTDCLSKAVPYLEIAEELAIKGLVLIENIQDSGIERTDEDHRLISSKSRLLQLAGLASRYDRTRKASSRHAMSMLGDAAATLRGAVPLFQKAENAIIDLRRAEVRLREAASIAVPGIGPFEMWIYDRLSGPGIYAKVPERVYHHVDSAEPSGTQASIAKELKEQWQKDLGALSDINMLSQVDQEILQLKIQQAEVVEFDIVSDFHEGGISEDLEDFSGDNESQALDVGHPDNVSQDDSSADSSGSKIKELWEIGNEIQNEIIEKHKSPDETTSARMREITSRATDALRFLDRAEPVLRERRRNVSWTTCYFELRLRAISFILWASIVQEKMPIPYLGLEAAMRKTETEPDQLLNDAVRMIRVDSYRLAMVILTYASCARALQIRLALDNSAVRLPERLAQMHSNLEHAILNLEAVIGRRNGPEGSIPQESINSQLMDRDRGVKRLTANRKREVNVVVQKVVDEALRRSKDVLRGLEQSS
jgi:hypothetical protein